MGEKTVVLIGRTLLLDGIAVHLTDAGILPIYRLPADHDELPDLLRRLRPAIIITDRSLPDHAQLFALLMDLSDSSLIRLDHEQNSGVVVRFERLIGFTMAELRRYAGGEADLPAYPSATRQGPVG